MLVAGPARAVTSEAVQIDAGPGGRQLDPVWVMKCPDAERLVGIRLHRDGQIAGVRAFCARVRLDDSGTHWLGSAALLPEPKPAPQPRVETVTRVVRGEGTILRASSGGVTRERASRALIITDAALRAPLKKAGYLTRDQRMKERKKPGQPGARRRFQFSKR